MSLFRVRARLMAVQDGLGYVHVGCFGEVVLGPDYRHRCQKCEKVVRELDEDFVSCVIRQDIYEKDVEQALARVDELEEQIAEMEDASRRPDPEQERLRKQYVRDQGPDHYDRVVAEATEGRRNATNHED